MSDNDHPTTGSPDELRRRFQILERVAIFFTLPDNILHALSRRLAPASAAKGSVIVHQGDPGDTMFIVESGRCEVYVEESPGHTITIALMGPDDFFGEMALISEETRTASVRALEDCRLLTLDRKTLYETVPADSDALIELRIPFPRFYGAVHGWVAAGFILAWALPLFGHHLGLPWAIAHP